MYNQITPQGVIGDIIAKLAPIAGNLAGQAAPMIPFAAGPQPKNHEQANHSHKDK